MTAAAPDGNGPAAPGRDGGEDGVNDSGGNGVRDGGGEALVEGPGGPHLAHQDTADQDAGDEDTAAEPHRHLAHTWQEARQLAFECAVPIPAAPVPLRQTLGRTLAADVVARQDMPHYASSAMDGWAVNGSGPWILAEPGQRLAPHQASPIATGGLIPPGAKAVLRSESGIIDADDDGLPVLKLGGTAKPGDPRNGDHFRKAGEEAAAVDVLIKGGTVLNPAHLALAALAGSDALPVLGKAVVRLVFTGSEVVTSGIPAPGQVRDTFGPQLAAVVGMLGGICTEEVKVGDTYAEWLAALEDTDPAGENLPADVVITTGGTGRSGTDHLRRSVAELGGRLLIDGIAMRPGHPAVLAELPDGRYILGLPGNPLVTTSEPVKTRRTTALPSTGKASLPASAASARWAGFRTVPPLIRTSPAAASSPAFLMWSPLRGSPGFAVPPSFRTGRPSSSTSMMPLSLRNTALAPGGMRPPVAIGLA